MRGGNTSAAELLTLKCSFKKFKVPSSAAPLRDRLITPKEDASCRRPCTERMAASLGRLILYVDVGVETLDAFNLGASLKRFLDSGCTVFLLVRD